MTVGDMREQIKQGARFVSYEYVISLVVVTWRRPSDVFYIPPGESKAKFHWPYTLVTLLLGWWGFPWGPAFTIGAVRDNVRGGHDVTPQTIDIIFRAAINSPGPKRSTKRAP